MRTGLTPPPNASYPRCWETYRDELRGQINQGSEVWGCRSQDTPTRTQEPSLGRDWVPRKMRFQGGCKK